MDKQKMSFIFKGILASLLAVLFMAPVVNAQESSSTEFTLEEITVTAQKRETNLQKTPVSIQTVTGEELVAEAKQRIDEIMQGVVGVQTQGSQTGTDFFMRGLGTADFGPPVGGANQSAVAVLIDGFYQNRGEVVRGGTLDMARAEVMRGTQSTTLGGSSLAGAVSLVSNSPVFKYEGSGSLGVGDYNLLTTQAVLNVPLADNQALRFAYSTEKRDGYLSSNAGNSDQANGRIKYRWQPTETFNLVATASKQVIGGNGVDVNSLSYYGYWEGYNAANAGSYDVTMGYPVLYGHVNNGVKYDKRDNPWDDGLPFDKWPNNVFRHTNIYQYSVDIDWDLSIGRLSLIPSYQTASYRSQETPRGSQSNNESWNAEQRNQRTIQVDAQLASHNDAPFEWLTGLYYYDVRFTGEMYSANLNSNIPGTPNYRADLPTSYYDWESTNPSGQTTSAAYGNLSYPVLDVLRLKGGLRYTKDEKFERKNNSRVVGTAAGPSGDYVYDKDNKASWSDVTYRVGAEYDVSDQAMVYALYATGYQPGTWGGNGSITPKQTLDQYTVGLKSRLLNKRLQLNIEGFNSTYYNRNLQGTMSYYSANYSALSGKNSCGQTPGAPPGPPSSGATVDFAADGSYACVDVGQGATVPELYSKGVDLEINFLISANDRIDASTEYLKSQQSTPDHGVTKSYLVSKGMSDALATQALNSLDALAESYKGLQLQNSPKWSANLSYSHIFTLPSGSTLTPKINMEYKDAYWSQGGGPPGPGAANVAKPGNSIQDAYTLWNAYLNWNSSDGQFSINAYIKNIQNKPILTNYGTEGLTSVTLAPPRTFGMVFNVKL